MNKIRPKILACLFLLAVSISFVPGCESTESVQAERQRVVEKKTEVDDAIVRGNENLDELKATIDALRADRERLVQTVATLQAGSAERASAETAIAAATASMVEVSKRIEDSTKKIDEAKSISNDLASRIASADKIIASTEPGAPNPGSELGGILGVLIPGAAALSPVVGGLIWRGINLARANSTLKGDVSKRTVAIERIVASIDALAKIAPEVRIAIQKNAEVIDAIQTPIGKMEVDRAQAKNVVPPTIVVG